VCCAGPRCRQPTAGSLHSGLGRRLTPGRGRRCDRRCELGVFPRFRFRARLARAMSHRPCLPHRSGPLAVYASHDGSPHHHARLASGPLTGLWPYGTDPLGHSLRVSGLHRRPSSRIRLLLTRRHPHLATLPNDPGSRPLSTDIWSGPTLLRGASRGDARIVGGVTRSSAATLGGARRRERFPERSQQQGEPPPRTGHRRHPTASGQPALRSERSGFVRARPAPEGKPRC
jgi:hypothetical protein